MTRTEVVEYSTNSSEYFIPRTWSTTPKNIDSLSSLDKFKKNMKLCEPNCCLCKICRVYLPDKLPLIILPLIIVYNT